MAARTESACWASPACPEAGGTTVAWEEPAAEATSPSTAGCGALSGGTVPWTEGAKAAAWSQAGWDSTVTGEGASPSGLDLGFPLPLVPGSAGTCGMSTLPSGAGWAGTTSGSWRSTSATFAFSAGFAVSPAGVPLEEGVGGFGEAPVPAVSSWTVFQPPLGTLAVGSVAGCAAEASEVWAMTSVKGAAAGSEALRPPAWAFRAVGAISSVMACSMRTSRSAPSRRPRAGKGRRK